MAKQLLRLVNKKDFQMTDEEHRNLGPRGIDILYGYDYSSQDVSEINSLTRAIRKDFPNTRYSDMKVCVLATARPNKLIFKPFLQIRIHVDDFLALRKEKKFDTI